MPSVIRLPVLALAVVGLSAPAHAQSPGAPVVIHNSGHSNSVEFIAFAPNGRWFASHDSTPSKCGMLPTDGCCGRWLGIRNRFQSIAIAPNGRTVVSASRDQTIRLWDAENGRTMHVWTGDPKRVTSVAFSPDGTSIASGGWDSSVKLWDASSGRLLATFPGAGIDLSEVRSLFAQRGAGASGDIPGKSENMGRAGGRLTRTIPAHTQSQGLYKSIVRIAVSPDGRTVVSASSDGTAKIWDAATGRLLQTLRHFDKFLRSIAISPDGRLINSAGISDKLNLWDTATGKLVEAIEFKHHSVNAVAFSLDGRSLAVGVSQSMKVFDVATGAPRASSYGPSDASSGTVSVSAAPDDRWFVVGSAGVTVWDARNWQLLFRHERNPGYAQAVTRIVAQDGTERLFVVTTSKERTIQLWDMTSSTLVRTFEWGPTPQKDRPCPACAPYGLENVLLSPDGRWLVATLWGDHTIIKVWSTASGRLLHNLPVPSIPYRAANKLAFSPDGRWLASESYDAQVISWIRLWDPKSGKLLKSFALPKSPSIGSAGGGTGVILSPDARWIVTGRPHGIPKIGPMQLYGGAFRCCKRPAAP